MANPLIQKKKHSTDNFDDSKKNSYQVEDYHVAKVNQSKEMYSNHFYKDKSPLAHRPLLHFNRIGGYEGTNPIIAPSVGGWDTRIREIGNCFYDAELGQYLQFYSGHTGAYSNTTVYVGLARSTDGHTWTRTDGTNSDGQILTAASEDPYCVKHKGTYYLYVEDKVDVPFRNIKLYTSTDLLNWTDRGDVLDVTAAAWDAQDVSSPAVFIENGTWYMLYEGRGGTIQGQIGLATSSDGITWAKSASNPVCGGTEGNAEIAWINEIVSDDIIKIGDQYYMTFHAGDGTKCGMAVSRDLINWVDYLGTWIEKENGTDNGDIMMLYNGKEFVFHYANNSSTSGILRGYPIIKNDYDVGAKDITTTGIITGDTISAGNGASGSFTTTDLKTVTVVDGIITSIV